MDSEKLQNDEPVDVKIVDPKIQEVKIMEHPDEAQEVRVLSKPIGVQDVRVIDEENDEPKEVKVINLPQLQGHRSPAPSLAPSRPPTTTLEEDIRTQAQRDLNMTWENTQSLISKIVVFTTCAGVIAGIIVKGFYQDRAIVLPSEWWAIVGLVIGFYFGRTNHARTSAEAPTSNATRNVNSNPLDDRTG